MMCKRQTISIIFLITMGWFNTKFAEGFGISSFGKANTDPPKPATTTVAPGRQCSRQAECAGITHSSCVRTQFDSVTRCLCGENSAPVNGQCKPTAKALYHVCSNSDDCNDGLTCGTPNITGPVPAHLKVHSPTDKICLCDPDTGFVEKDHTCSDAEILKTSLFAIFIVSCLRKLLAEY